MRSPLTGRRTNSPPVAAIAQPQQRPDARPRAARGVAYNQRARGRRLAGFALVIAVSLLYFCKRLYAGDVIVDGAPAPAAAPAVTPVEDSKSAVLGRSRRPTALENKKLRIAVVSNAVMWPDAEKGAHQLRRFNEFFANKQCYAETHGYDLIVDSRNHVEGMGFYVNGYTGEKGPTNIHFNKPYLLRKWLPQYDWLLWLDLDALIVDIARPVEAFIEQLNDEIHVLVPQDQNSVFFFSAYALLVRNSPESQEFLDDWFKLKDSCPFALYDDQSRLYAALLRMQLRYRNTTIDRSSVANTDCLDVCEKKETQKQFSWCFDKAVKKLKYGRIPWLKGPIAYSTLPIKGFTIGNDTGLAFQGMFGGIKNRPELVHKAFALHIKPTCVKNRITCAPYTDALLSSNYNRGMHKCFGNGWLADPLPLLTELATLEQGPGADGESQLLQDIPGMNMPFAGSFDSTAAGAAAAVQIKQTRQQQKQQQQHSKALVPYTFRVFGALTSAGVQDSALCYSAPPGSGADVFAELVATPAMTALICAHAGSSSTAPCTTPAELVSATSAARHMPCVIRTGVGQHFPYTLTEQYTEAFKQSYWLMTFLRDPVDRVIMAYVRTTAALDAAQERLPADPLNQCIDITSIGGASPSEISMRSYAHRPGSTEVYSKFYTREKWSPKQFGDSDMCIGYSLQKPYRAGGWKEYDYHQANIAAGDLLEHHYVGIYERWEASKQLLALTLHAGASPESNGRQLPPAVHTAIAALLSVTAEQALAAELPDAALRQQYQQLRADAAVRADIAAQNPKDVMLYEKALLEFERRCSYFGIAVR